MFKKSLIAVATLGAMVGGVCAADVQVYGVVDYGVHYTKFDQELTLPTPDGSVVFERDEDTFGLDSGLNAGSRFGLKGSEDLGNGMSVSFKLENGFSADDGKLGNGGRLFGREASLSINGAFGTISAGRMGGLTSSAGTYDVVMAGADAFDGGSNAIVTGFAMSDRYDNMLTYASPEFAGAKVYAQYSFQSAGEEKDDSNRNNRYASLGATYTLGNLHLVAAYEQFMYSSDGIGYDIGNDAIMTIANEKDGKTFTVGGNYDFGVTKVFGMAQIARNVDNLANFGIGTLADVLKGFDEPSKPTFAETYEGIDGYALHVGAITPVMGGNLTTALYYADAEDAMDSDLVADYVGVAVRYRYPLSARTSLYTGAGYSQQTFEVKNILDLGKGELETKNTELYVGLTHTF